MKVKKLVWDRTSSNGHLGCGYYIRQAFDGKYYTSREYLHPGMIYSVELDGSHDTIDAAKAAAQADFERRVMDCLEVDG